MHANIWIDGAARGNPGPAAFAYVIVPDKKPAIEGKGFIGMATNNFAEYTALVNALKRALELGTTSLSIQSDSELLVKQMNGQYRVKNPDLRALHTEAKELSRHFDSVTIRHIRREQNRRADELCNQVLDKVAGTDPDHGSSPRPPGPKTVQNDRAHDEAVTCLEDAAESWARGDPGKPSPEDIWLRLLGILERRGPSTSC
jgi:ribonuclease HI